MIISTLFTRLSFIIVFIGLVSSTLQAQFNSEDQHSFVKVYLETKEVKVYDSYQQEKLLSESGVSVARFQEIFRNKLIGNEDNLSVDELRLLADLAKVKTLSLQLEKKVLVQILDKHKLNRDIYSEILKKYHSDIVFQRSLQPLFILEMKSDE